MYGDPINKKDELLGLLKSVEPQAQRLEALGQDIVRTARLSRDVASPIRDLISAIPTEALSPDYYARQVDSWNAWKVAASELETSRTAVNSFNAVLLEVTSTSSASSGMIISIPFLPSPLIQTEVNRARERLYRTLELYPLVIEAQLSMKRLGLDSVGGSHRTPLQLLDEAQGAFQHPVLAEGSAVSCLIPLRECINSTLSELLRRRPNQEPASKARDKLLSLGRNCARSRLPLAHFERLASDADPLLNNLSGAKQSNMSRQQITYMFYEGVLFLNALINSIDETLLKSV